MDYDQRNPGMTTVTAVALGAKANRPDPADGARAVSFPLFKWSPGKAAALHDVYLGTSPEALELKGRQPLTLYIVPGPTWHGLLLAVDEVEQDGLTIHTGDVGNS
jgi:hypothetical protein